MAVTASAVQPKPTSVSFTLSALAINADFVRPTFATTLATTISSTLAATISTFTVLYSMQSTRTHAAVAIDAAHN